ncbi:MAG TPA: hypothetical protein VLA16_17535, partial [Ideonella sp.]|nr:hypothetical protein [Ideonella sp.]
MNLAAAPPPVAPPPPAASRRWAEAAWPALAGLLAAVALVLYAAPSGEWDWQPALAWREPWRWWTAAGVHWSAAHLAMNLAGCGVLALLGWRGGLGLRAAAAWALAWPLTQLALLAQPALLHYGGLSGVLHAGVAVVACHLWRHERGSRRW